MALQHENEALRCADSRLATHAVSDPGPTPEKLRERLVAVLHQEALTRKATLGSPQLEAELAGPCARRLLRVRYSLQAVLEEAENTHRSTRELLLAAFACMALGLGANLLLTLRVAARGSGEPLASAHAKMATQGYLVGVLVAVLALASWWHLAFLVAAQALLSTVPWFLDCAALTALNRKVGITCDTNS